MWSPKLRYVQSAICFLSLITSRAELSDLPTPVSQFSIGLSTVITQIFMLRRYWNLTKKKAVLYLASLLIFLACCEFVCVIGRFNDFNRFGHTDYIRSCRVQVNERVDSSPVYYG
ncbi:hypothetical protein K435DRAFT_796941 [Dendrothele bispora CBS 962.96]|uniref:Uncharacterized protein n=1 Tax=Dendrothele bispora (strain CBS 962.96) TaxID=1314807 RepID=A0A4S8M411_DENBC|nr:hypothetical protein K435DRAFT_796941 [Dendrothele bispora CBS 962.96]